MESFLTADISAGAVRHNLRLLRERLTGGATICAVVQADCYGHGRRLLWPILAEHVDALAVATPHEAIELRDQGYEGEVLMFFSTCAYDEPEYCDALEELVARNVTLTVVSPREVQSVAEAVARVDRPARVHVMIDTGMGRSGILPDFAGSLIKNIDRTPRVGLTGLYTHFATADEADKSFTRQQLSTFLETIQPFRRPGVTLHAANSAATIDLPETHLDWVRPGIAIYGYQPSEQMHTKLPLKPALRLSAMLMQVKTLRAGSRCGYGLTHRFDADTRVGLVPVGYGDGYLRSLSNNAVMRVRGHDAPIRGRVSMDQIIIDLSAVPDARVGDAVEILSPDPLSTNSVEALARRAGTIPYEIICRLGARVRRNLVE